MAEQQGTDRDALLEQQRVLAEFGDLALKTEDLDDILDKACGLVGRALETDFAKVMELSPDGRTFKVRAGVGWKPGVVGVVSVTAVENSPEGLTLAQGSVISSNRQTERRFEYHDFMIDHGVKAFVNVLILSSKGRAAFGVLQVDSRNPRNFTQSDIEFLRSYANLLGAAIERLRAVDELRQSVRDKDLLINELNHRVKNTLATVQSLATQTARGATTPATFRERFEGRLIALSKAHDQLTIHHWESVDLRDLLSGSLAPYAGTTPDRVVLRGEDVVLRPRAVLTLAMAVHELTTNAAKYGALSVPSGSVEVQWRPVRAENGGPCLQIEWIEQGGPNVVEPEQHGFGTKLIEGSIASDLAGKTQLVFQPQGLRCEITIPMKAATVHFRVDTGKGLPA